MGIYTEAIQKLYVAYFNRPADYFGLAHWESVVAKANGSTAAVSAAFAASKEYQDTYAGMDFAHVVNAVYVNLFGRPATDLAGLAFWVNALQSGATTIDQVVTAIAAGAQGTDKVAYDSKVSAATAFTASLDTNEEVLAYSGDAANAIAKGFISTVTDAASLATAIAEANLNSVVGDIIEISKPVVEGLTVTLTTGIDAKNGLNGDDTFDGSVNANGTATLTSVDVLNGAAGNDTVIAEMTGATIAPKLTAIETVELISRNAGSTFDMINTVGATSILTRNSSADITLNNINSVNVALEIRDQADAGDVTLNYTNAALAGSNDTVTVTLNNAQAGAASGPDLTINQNAGADASGAENVTLVSGGSNTNFLGSLSTGGSAGKLTVTGANSLEIATALDTSISEVVASGLTGALRVSVANAADDIKVSGGTGNDSLTMTANTGKASVTGGAGNDTIRFNAAGGFTTDDTISGGDGSADILNVVAADAEAITAALTNVTGFERLYVNTSGTASSGVNTTRFGEIATFRLGNATTATSGAYSVTMGAGTRAVQISSEITGALTLNDTGSATTDAITLSNLNTEAQSAFNAQDLTVNGWETVTIATGSNASGLAGTAQTLGTVTLNGDSTSGVNTLKFTGANAVSMTALVSNSSGVLTVDASGMTAQVAGTTTFTVPAATFSGGITGTVKITGSDGQDVLNGHASAANTIDGGAGVDTINGGSGADSLSGGAGIDTIATNGGNDTVLGGDGNDSITATAGTVNIDAGAGNDTVRLDGSLSAGDVVNGGEGSADTLRISAAATAATAASVTNFERLTLDVSAANITQEMVQFIGSNSFDRINLVNGAFTATVNQVGASVATLSLSDADLTGVVIDRLIDTTSNSLSILASGATAARTFTTVTVSDEETVSIATGTAAAGDITITTLNADDTTSLTVTGAGDLTVTTLANAANLATLNASAATGVVTINASSSVADMTVTGSLSASSVLTAGTGNDTMTGGDAADTLTGGNGADNMNGGAAADVLDGGLGADVVNGGIGDDTITGGVGNDALTGGVGADDFVFTAASNGVDSIADFIAGTDDLDVSGNILGAVVAGQTITSARAAAALTQLSTDDTVHFVTTNGAAANLTTGGTLTLSSADLTASTLTNLAAYLGEQWSTATSGANTNDSVIVLNWTAGGNTTSYVYEYVNDNTDNALQAAELTLIAVVNRSGGDVLASGDVI